MTTDRTPQRGYAKPVVVPDRLDLLAGLTTGVVTLPRHLKWSGNPRYERFPELASLRASAA